MEACFNNGCAGRRARGWCLRRHGVVAQHGGRYGAVTTRVQGSGGDDPCLLPRQQRRLCWLPGHVGLGSRCTRRCRCVGVPHTCTCSCPCPRLAHSLLCVTTLNLCANAEMTEHEDDDSVRCCVCACVRVCAFFACQGEVQSSPTLSPDGRFLYIGSFDGAPCLT